MTTNTAAQGRHLKFAIPTTGGRLCRRFGQCEQFAFIAVHATDRQILATVMLAQPRDSPEGLAAWLAGLGVSHVIACGLGALEHDLLVRQGIEVVAGDAGADPEGLVLAHLAG